jgi:hypothetical protein
MKNCFSSDHLLGYFTIYDYIFVTVLLRNVLHPSSDWLYLVQVESELNGRRKWVNRTGRLQGLLRIWVTRREEERDLAPCQLSKRNVLSVLYNQPIFLRLLQSLPETNSVTLKMGTVYSSETPNQPYNPAKSNNLQDYQLWKPEQFHKLLCAQSSLWRNQMLMILERTKPLWWMVCRQNDLVEEFG